VRPSERYVQHSKLLIDFRNAYVALINNSKQDDDYFSLSNEYRPAPGVNPIQWSRLRTDVAKAAGAATEAYKKWGGTFTFRNAAFVMPNVDPVANWAISLTRPQQLRPDTVVACAEAAAARAMQAANEAGQRERGLTGLIAAFLRWPSTLREAVDPDHRGQRAAAGAIGFVGQIIVGAVAAALATGLVAGAVALWGLAF